MIHGKITGVMNANAETQVYNTLDEGYNMVYKYRDAAHTIEAIKENPEYISLCLRKTEIEWNKV